MQRQSKVNGLSIIAKVLRGKCDHRSLAAIFSFSDFGCACVGTYEKWVVLKTTRLSGVERIVVVELHSKIGGKHW